MYDQVFSPEQVVNLLKWQMNPFVHPFTCPDRNDGNHAEILHEKGTLIPTVRGWECPFCYYTQDWAHDFMLRETVEEDI